MRKGSELYNSPAMRGDLLAVLDFLEEEAADRASAGSEYSDYEREPNELADRLRGVLAALAQPSPLDTSGQVEGGSARTNLGYDAASGTSASSAEVDGGGQ